MTHRRGEQGGMHARIAGKEAGGGVFPYFLSLAVDRTAKEDPCDATESPSLSLSLSGRQSLMDSINRKGGGSTEGSIRE